MRRSAALRLRALAAAAVVLTGGAAAVAEAESRPAPVRGSAAKTPFQLVRDRLVQQRLPQPEDRYAVAGGCYTVQAGSAGFVGRDGDTLVLTRDRATATPFHFQPTRLGEYLLATNEGRDTRYPGATWDVRGYAAASPRLPVANQGLTAAPQVADAPSPDAEWRLVAAGAQPERKRYLQQYELQLPARDQVLAVQGGALVLAGSGGVPLTLRHVRDDDPRDADGNGRVCASWPEISTGTSGRPAPVKGSPAQRVQGFWESHIHGMAFEFVGGKSRCGQPWHRYGVEHALYDCRKNGPYFDALLSVGLGKEPDAMRSYDPVGWPTFSFWPQQDLLAHEQLYWKWLERAYHGGLRIMTNLLVENAALCQLHPAKKNSCNEMDSVRLQAQRLHELQDYVDAQSGGPGEGWFRIVTTPAEARATINAGRLAVVMGVEVSEPLDCREVLDQPLCTQQQIDDRLQELLDMGVRQMELVNKFDNALSGVAGDAGNFGVLVNNGQRTVTGHNWDMRTCVEDPHSHGPDGDEHDKRQYNVADDSGAPPEFDVLAGQMFEAYGGATRGYVAPAYGPGPHCNARGLTELGKHTIRRMVDNGIMFDPDHMSALGARQALDLIEKEIAPAKAAAARRAGRPVVVPGVLSSHSWANDVIYQRIYGLSGVIGPRTDDAAGFADRWAQSREFARKNAPRGYDFGVGYGADTNGFATQPPPRAAAKQRIDYRRPWRAPIGGVLIGQQTSGLRAFDVNKEGAAHYGLFADWYREVQLAADEKHAKLGGGKAVLADMLDGAESYLSMWERAVYGTRGCVKDNSGLQAEDLHAALGLNAEGFLRAVGQPADREDDVWVYCAGVPGGGQRLVEVAFSADGRAQQAQVTDRPAADASDVVAPAEPAAAAPAAAAPAARHDHASHPHGVATQLAAATSGLPGGTAGYVALLLVGLTSAGLAGALRRGRRTG